MPGLDPGIHVSETGWIASKKGVDTHGSSPWVEGPRVKPGYRRALAQLRGRAAVATYAANMANLGSPHRGVFRPSTALRGCGSAGGSGERLRSANRRRLEAECAALVRPTLAANRITPTHFSELPLRDRRCRDPRSGFILLVKLFPLGLMLMGGHARNVRHSRERQRSEYQQYCETVPCSPCARQWRCTRIVSRDCNHVYPRTFTLSIKCSLPALLFHKAASVGRKSAAHSASP